VIVSPSSVGIVAAAQAVKDQGKIGKVYVTGWGCRLKWPAREIRRQQKLRHLEPD
jgi:hypothetical protein